MHNSDAHSRVGVNHTGHQNVDAQESSIEAQTDVPNTSNDFRLHETNRLLDEYARKQHREMESNSINVDNERNDESD